jgi:hypothetical protein
MLPLLGLELTSTLFMEEYTEPKFPYPAEPSYPSLNLGRLVLINGPLLTLVGLLFVAAGQAEGYLGGLEEILAAWGLMGLGFLANLIAVATTKGSRTGYAAMAFLYGAVFCYFFYIFSHMGNLKPGG